MTEVLETIYGPRHHHKNDLGGGSSSFEQDRAELFLSWIGTGKRVLDLGCRDGRISKHLLAAGNQVIGFDIDSAALKLCPPGMTTEHHDLNGDWQVGHGGEFDVVVATEVVEHLYYPDRVVNKIVSVLKPGGVFVGSVPNAFNLKNRIRLLLARPNNTPLGEPTHINQFSYAMIGDLLRRHFTKVTTDAIVQPRFRWFAKIFPGLGGFLITFCARK